MLKTSYKLLFSLSLITGTLVSISSSSWLSVWMGLEINLLSFIPLSMNSNNLFSAEASIKYFLTQALASSTLLFTIILYTSKMEHNLLMKSNILFNLIFASSLMMKSGVAPFHFWFPNVMEGLNWNIAFILMTWQKLAPIILLSFCLSKNFFNTVIILSIFVGAMGGLNQTSLRKLMAFSSINHLGWLMGNMLINENIWKMYFLFYSFLSLTVIVLFNIFKMFNLNQMFSFMTKSKSEKLLFMIPLLSLGGLPPFTGFFPKWITIQNLTEMNFILLTFLMVNFTLITLYFYLRLTYSSFLMNHNSLNWNFSWNLMKIKPFKTLIIMIMFSMFGLPLINLSFYFF